jgi:hypothetical protein
VWTQTLLLLQAGTQTHPLLLIHELCLQSSQAPFQRLYCLLTLHQVILQLISVCLEL